MGISLHARRWRSVRSCVVPVVLGNERPVADEICGCMRGADTSRNGRLWRFLDGSILASKAPMSATRLSSEHRRDIREIVAWAALWYDSAGSPRRGVVCDVSRSGLLLKNVGGFADVVREGQQVKIVFVPEDRPSRTAVTVVGTVRWVGGRGNVAVGVQFDQVHPELERSEAEPIAVRHAPPRAHPPKLPIRAVAAV